MLTATACPVVATLADIVSINSINPAYDQGVPEAAMADYVQEFFAEREIETTRRDALPGRPNVIAKLPGKDSSRRVIFEAHMDTVSITGMEIPPWEPNIEGGKLYGRGSCDTKGGFAAMMHALASLKEDRITPPCDVWFAAAIDEEYAFRGVTALCKDLKADAAVIAEPTSLRAVIASKGLVRWRILSHGRAAHSSKPHLGVNAIEHMARVILAIEEDNKRLSQTKHPLLGPATCNVGVIHGGVQINFVPDECAIEIDRRLLPGETPAGVLAQYQQLVDRIAAAHPDACLEMEAPMLTDVPLETSPDSRIAKVASEVINGMKLDGELIGVPFCSDASKFGQIGIPSIILGPGSIDQAHAAVEYIECEQVEQAVEIYRRLMLQLG